MLLRTIKEWGIWIIIGTFIIIFNPPLLLINFMHVVGLISLVKLVTSNSTRVLSVKLGQIERSLYLSMILIFLFLAVQYIVIRESWNSLTIPVYFMLDVIPFALVVKLRMKKNELQSDSLMDLFYMISIIQAIIALLCYILPDFHEIIIKVFTSYGYDDAFAMDARYRNFGYAGGLTFSTAIYQSIISAMMLVNYRKQKLSGVLWGIVILFSAIINARTSIVTFAIAIVVSLFFSKIPMPIKIRKIAFLFFLSLLSVFLILPFILSSDSETFSWVISGYREIIGFLNNNVSSESYFSYVLNKDRWILPTTIGGILFGEGHFIVGGLEKYGIYSDIGYINDIWQGGIIYLVFVYSVYYKMMIRLYKHLHPMISTFALMLMVMFPIVNIKGPIFGMNDITNMLVILVICEGGKKGGDMHDISSYSCV